MLNIKLHCKIRYNATSFVLRLLILLRGVNNKLFEADHIRQITDFIHSTNPRSINNLCFLKNNQGRTDGIINVLNNWQERVQEWLQIAQSLYT